MNWLRNLLTDPDSSTTACLVFAAVVAGGVWLGSVKIRGVKLGVAGVLFSGLAVGHFGVSIDHHILEFAREFGLVLFVYTLGLAVGPGFLNAFRADGVRLNALAAMNVLLGVGCIVLAHLVGGVPLAAAVGVYCGATTNTPSLAAASQALHDSNEAIDPTGLGVGYAVAYPFGVVGIILTMLMLRWLLRVDPAAAAAAEAARAAAARRRVERSCVRVTNPNLTGMPLGQVPLAESAGLVVSRVSRGGEVQLARADLRLQPDDLLLAVGDPATLDQFRVIVGEKADVDLVDRPGPLASQWLTVSRREGVGETTAGLELRLQERVQITRLRRAEVELSAAGDVRIQMGDQLRVVGPPEAIATAARLLGDTPKALDRPEFAPLFVGVVLGLLLGAVPVLVPGLPAPVRLGLAGGPLLVALLVSQVSRVGPVVSYLPPAGNLALRELGISLFLAAVGLKSGGQFVATFSSGDGLYWMAVGAVVTVLPLFVVGGLAARVFGYSFVSVLGLLAGSMTDPPALAFAHAQARSELPSVSYAAVYPLTMILRVLSAQVLVLMFV